LTTALHKVALGKGYKQ